MMKDESPQMEFNDCTVEIRNHLAPCKLKISGSGITYKVAKTGKSETVDGDDIDSVSWQRLGGGFGVRVFTSDGNLHRFGGFKDSDESKVEKIFSKALNKKMAPKEYSLKGWNYGKAVFDGSALNLVVGSASAFEVPLTNVSGCQVGKNEVTLEFHQPEECPTNLMEMRFHIPPTEASEDDPVEAFQKKVLDKASVITATGVTLCIFQEINCLTPRGRYDIKIFPSTIQLHGKSFNFNISVDNVQKLFLLPHMDGIHHLFLVSVDPPIKQGQTRYPFLVIQFDGDKEEEIEIPLTEEEIKEKFEGRLEKEMFGSQFEVVSKFFKGICSRKIVAPGNFLGQSGFPCVSCSYKAALGYLYPLERGFIFCHKPPIHLRFEDIDNVHFARSESTTRTFDVEIQVKRDVAYVFSSIEKGEYQRLYEHCKSKKLKVKSTGQMDNSSNMREALSDIKGDDHYMNRVVAEAPSDDDDSSTDEDFVPGEEGGDVKEEFDSGSASSSGSGEEEPAGSDDGLASPTPKKKAAARPRKPKAEGAEGGKKKRGKLPKDENRPKRPMSSYFLWMNEHREQIKTDNPGIKIAEISKKAGEMWKEVTDKTEWEEKAAEAKVKYEEAMKEYIANGGSNEKVQTGGKGSPAKKAAGKKGKKGPAASHKVSETSGGTGTNFKSTEFIESDSSSADEESSKATPPKKKKKKNSGDEKEKSADNASDADASGSE